MTTSEPPTVDPSATEDCLGCQARAVYWNPYNRVVQCHACGQIAQTVLLTKTELFMLLGQVGLTPFEGHPEADDWDCAPLAEIAIDAGEKAIDGREGIWVPQQAQVEPDGPSQHDMIVDLLKALGVEDPPARPESPKEVWEAALANVRAMAAIPDLIEARRQVRASLGLEPE